MHRRIARWFFILVCSATATVLGVLGALLFTPPGRHLLVRIISDQSNRVLRGSLRIGGVSGTWLRGFTLTNVEIRDTSGAVFVSAPLVRVNYDLSNLLGGRFVLSAAALDGAEMHIVKHRGGRTNLEEIFRLGEGPGGGASPLIEIRNLAIRDTRVVIRVPWNPDGRLRTQAQADSALTYQRERLGRRIESGPEGLELIRTVDQATGFLPLLRISSPDREPITAEVDRLAARVSDPALEIRDFRGQMRTKHDSLIFRAETIELPGTSARGEGRLDWPRDTLLYRLSLTLPKLALADLRWISPEFPAFTGSGRVRATSLSGSRSEFDIRELSLRDATSRLNGRMVAITDLYRGLGFRGLNLTLDDLDLDVVRGYLDTLPFHGRVSGALEADGFFDSMTVALDWDFQDELVPGAGSRVALTGPIRFGGSEGLGFLGTRVLSSDIDLRTARRLAPSVTLNGRLTADGMLAGPLLNVVFDGRAAHRDGEGPESRLTGRVRLDNRGSVVGIETDVVLDSLSFAGLRGSYPSLGARGSLGGTVKLAGTLERLAVDADVGGALGRVRARGGVTLYPPRWGADSLQASFEQLDLSALAVGAPRTQLTGRLAAHGNIEHGEGVGSAPAGTVSLQLGAGTLGGFLLDSADVRVRAADGLIRVDTAITVWRGGRVEGGGSLGWAAPDSGRLVLRFTATDLSHFDSLALAVTGFRRDTARNDAPLRGGGQGDLVLSGALPSLRLDGSLMLDSVRWLGYRARTLAGRLAWNRADQSLRAAVSADSLRVRRLSFTGLGAQVRGRPDSLQWAAELAGWGAVGRVGAGGRIRQLHVGTSFETDSLNLHLLGRRWSLDRPLRAVLDDQAIVLDTVRFVTADGSGSVELAGNVPRDGAGTLSIRALGIELRDLYGLLQRDTTGIAGVVAVDGRINGTARQPELRGTATLTGAAFGDFHAPVIRGAFDYRERQLQGNVTFWRAGKPVVQADATLPIDLALAGAETRQLPGPITIVARGDSIDLAILEAFTPNLRQVTGQMDVDARIEGTWETPRLAGWVRLREGAATVPGLGVRYQDIGGAIRLVGDSILSDSLRLGGRFGELRIGGGLRLDRLTRPVLDLDLVARDFEVMDVPTFMSLRSSGEVHLAGTLQHPVLTGRGRIANSVIYFADLVTKEIVNLEDPLFADLVDTLALRRYALGAAFQSRFLDSLAIRNVQLEIGEGVWLRSNEANFQLEGSVLINKSPYSGADQLMYRIVGDLNVPRGTYTLKAGAVLTRTFTVERGTVRYFGDPNAVLNIQAQHVVRAPQRGTETIPVIAHITGTMAVPKLTVSTAPDQPPLTEQQLINLLTVGSTDLAFAVEQQAFVAAANALASELQRALISDPNSPVDILEIRPGVSTGGTFGQGVATQLAVGRALTERLFVTANAGFCLTGGQAGFNARNLGATLEYRFRADLRAQLSAEPVQTCQRRGVDIFGTARRYQFGAELRWDRDF